MTLTPGFVCNPSQISQRGSVTSLLALSTRLNRAKKADSAGDTHINFIKLAKVHGVEAVNGRSDVLAVSALLHHLQLPHARDVGQARLDLRHVRHLRRCGLAISPQKSSSSITDASHLLITTFTFTFSAQGLSRFHNNHQPDRQSP